MRAKSMLDLQEGRVKVLVPWLKKLNAVISRTA